MLQEKIILEPCSPRDAISITETVRAANVDFMKLHNWFTTKADWNLIKADAVALLGAPRDWSRAIADVYWEHRFDKDPMVLDKITLPAGRLTVYQPDPSTTYRRKYRHQHPYGEPYYTFTRTQRWVSVWPGPDRDRIFCIADSDLPAWESYTLVHDFHADEDSEGLVIVTLSSRTPSQTPECNG